MKLLEMSLSRLTASGKVAGFSFQFPAMMGVRLLTPLANEEESSYQIEVSSSGRG
jgi:hypothetical protein